MIKHREQALFDRVEKEVIGERLPHNSTHNPDYPYTKGYGHKCYCDLGDLNKRVTKQLKALTTLRKEYEG